MSGLRRGLPVALAIVALFVVAEALGSLGRFLFLPRASSVLAAWWQMAREGVLLPTLLGSLRALVIGYAAAAVAGVGVGLLVGRFRLLGEVLDPFINVLMSAPLVALVPVLITLFGINEIVVVLTVFLFSFFVILVNARAGIRGTEPSLVDMAASLGAGELQAMSSIYLPSALPSIMVGLQLGAVTAVKGLLVGEMLVALTGLGELLAKYANMFLITRLYATILTILVLALLASYAVQAADRLLIRWK